MKNPSQQFLRELGSLPPDSFEGRFSQASNQLDLARTLSRNELALLFEASLKANSCNLVINTPGDLRERNLQEANCSRLELEFMVARDILYASPGWQTLESEEKEAIEKVFLGIAVADEQLAW